MLAKEAQRKTFINGDPEPPQLFFGLKGSPFAIHCEPPPIEFLVFPIGHAAFHACLAVSFPDHGLEAVPRLVASIAESHRVLKLVFGPGVFPVNV
jgi:hypothetical protein